MNEYQRGIYLEEKITDCKSANNIGGVIRFDGIVDAVTLTIALKRVIYKHPNLRCSLDNAEFTFEDENSFTFELIESNFHSIEEYELHLHKIFEETGVMDSNRLFYSELCHVDKASFLIIRCHHIIADGYSMASLANDLNEYWSSNCDYSLEKEIDMDYGDKSVFEENKEEYLAKSATSSMTGAIYEAQRTTMQFPTDLQNELQQFVKEQNYSMFTVLLYAFSCALLHFQQEEILQIGIPVSVLRLKKDRPIGMFVNIVPFFTEREVLESESGIGRLRHLWFKAARNYRFPYYKIKSVVGETFEKYDYTFNYLPNVYPPTIGGFPVELHNVHPKYQAYRLQGLVETHNDNNMYMVLDWNVDTYALGFDKYFIELYFNVLKAVVSDSRLTSDTFCMEIDRKLMEDCQACFVPVRDDVETNPYALFRYNCINFADSTAIMDGDNKYTYKEFERDVLRMSAVLKIFGLEPNSKVILDLEHTYYELVLVYALLYLGSTMVPVSSRNWETRRIASVMEQVKPCLYVSDSKGIPKGVRGVSLSELIVYNVNDYLVEADGYYKDCFDAYIIFTSGTTGVPKGVIISEKSLFSYLNWAKAAYKMSEHDCMPLYTTMTFDFTLTTVYLPLSSSACIKLYPDDGIRHPLYDIFEDNSITVVKVTPSHMKLISLIDKEYCAELRLLIVGGENLSYETLRRFRKRFKRDFVCCNEYGPTEATIGCVVFFTEEFDKRGNVPIGLPSSNAQVRIVNEEGKDLTCYVKGQLLLSGDCLSTGYWNDEKKTSEAFISSEGKLWYKSGDVAWYNSNGYIEYGGRADGQTKYHGYRIEMEEIKTAVSDCPSVKDSIALMIYQNEEQRIVLFYIPELIDEVSEADIKSHLYNKLPNYIVVELCAIDRLPLTLNGKIDEKKLRAYYAAKLNEATVDSDDDILFMSELKAIVAKTLGISESFDISKSFYELGGDSIKSFACLTMLKEGGYAPKQNYFRMPISIAEISRLLIKETEHFEALEYDVAFEPTALIKRFIENAEDIGSVMQCIVIEPIKEFDAVQLLKSIYASFSALRLTVTEEKKLLYRSSIQVPYIVETTYNLCDEHCRFDIENEGLFKLIYFMDIKKYGICIHHLAVDFVSWQIIFEFLNAFLLGKSNLIEMGTAFSRYCERNRKSVLFAEHDTADKSVVNISITDIGILEKLFDSKHLYGVNGEVIIKSVVADIFCSFYGKDKICFECESIGRDNDELDIGWDTDIYYENYDRVLNKFMDSRSERSVRPIRFNYIPMYEIKEYETFKIRESFSRFTWNCHIAYEAEFDIIITRSELKFCVLVSDASFADYLEQRLPDSVNSYLSGMYRLDIDFSKDEDVEIDDLIKLLG